MGHKFEDKIKTLYHDYFGKDVLEECDCGGCDGGAMEGGGATNCSFVVSINYAIISVKKLWKILGYFF